jgi:hypothetical protein
MTIPNYTKVEIVTDKFEALGVPRGSYGFVIEVYDDGEYEVEVSDPERGGITIALFSANDTEIRPAE